MRTSVKKLDSLIPICIVWIMVPWRSGKRILLHDFCGGGGGGDDDDDDDDELHVP
jgi:hypothetical protein